MRTFPAHQEEYKGALTSLYWKTRDKWIDAYFRAQSIIMFSQFNCDNIFLLCKTTSLSVKCTTTYNVPLIHYIHHFSLLIIIRLLISLIEQYLYQKTSFYTIFDVVLCFCICHSKTS